ncbi:unnamed protein product [Adineta ricciae]|uniref:Uncharacterized protein n=1 Tax=Adineta ricciae TaxID=249248 RepID=A0A815D088_ADIRI|nr:unnamed protein product [Adineta ricciae]
MADLSVHELSPLMFHASRAPLKTDMRSTWQKRLSMLFVLLAVGFERLTFYSLSGNLILFLTSHHIRWTSRHSLNASFIFFGASYASALFFSWISDAKVGRVKTIVIGFLIYIVGYVFFPLFSHGEVYKVICGGPPVHIHESAPYFHEKCSIQITAALVITAIGIGAVEANIAVLGAEQIRGQKATTQYFAQYYTAVNLGSFLAYGIIAYVQQNRSYHVGYLISIGLLAFTLVLFLAGYKYYIPVKPHDSVVTNFFPVMINAFRSWRTRPQRTRNIHRNHRFSRKALRASDQLDISENLAFDGNEQSRSFLDYAKVEYNGQFPDRVVDDIKALRRIIVMFILLIPYWLLYVQLRFILGMLAAALSMCLTGIVEIFRQQSCSSSFPQTIGDTVYNASDMSVFYQLPQYVSMGVSEVFASIASLEFAYLTAPQSAQSFVMSLRFCSVGLSSFLASGYMNIYDGLNANFSITNSECKDAEKPQLFYVYFFVLAGIQIILLFVFLACDRRFRIIKASEHRFNTRLFIGSNVGTSDT